MGECRRRFVLQVALNLIKDLGAHHGAQQSQFGEDHESPAGTRGRDGSRKEDAGIKEDSRQGGVIP